MPKPYDDAMKRLVGGNPQDLVSWILPGAQFGQQLPFELSVENIYADGLLQVSLDGKEFLAHFEFQSSYDRPSENDCWNTMCWHRASTIICPCIRV